MEGYITHVVESIKLYKADPNTYYDSPEIRFVPKDHDDECTLTPEIGRQYFLDL